MASTKYGETNVTHRQNTSDVQVADERIVEILAIEAGQVSRTRQTLDEASQYLYDYGLATARMNFIPTLAMAKSAADATAAGTALASTNSAMMTLVKNSVENAMRIRESTKLYEGAAAGSSGDDPGECGTFVPPLVDKANLPSRIQRAPTTPSLSPRSRSSMARRPRLTNHRRPDHKRGNVTDQNLHVVTDHINRLAEMQRTAADKIMGSNRTTADVAGNVLSTHGLVCSATSIALSTAETARKAAGATLYKVSTELDAKLTTAAINYADADYRSGASIGQACEV